MINSKVIFSAILIMTSFSSSAFFNLKSNDASKDSSALSALSSALGDQDMPKMDSPIISELTNKLNVSPEQAAGGAGALLSLASNSLSSSNNNELSQLIPGFSSLQNSVPGLSQLATNSDGVSSVFSSLGLDPSLVSKFAPIILQYLTSQNASSGLLGSLGDIWGN